jgi:predicted DNA-binding transcriptional regulator AlpA
MPSLFATEPKINPFLNADQVAERYSVSKASVWRWTKTNERFPSPLKIGPNCTRWRLADLEAFDEHLSAVSMKRFPSPYDHEE